MSDLAASPTPGATTPSASRRLFDELNRRGLRYCHFKSNLTLDRALRGETDLDLFVDPADRDAFHAVVMELGFKQTRSHWPLDVPEVEHFFGLDAETGALLHPHVYYELLVGPRSVKDHRLRLTGWLLEGSRLIDAVRVPSVETELVLLYIRANLKVDAARTGRSLVKKTPVYARGELEEFRWLAGQADAAEITRRVEATGLPLDAAEVLAFVERVRSGDLPPAYAWETRKRVRRAVRDRRTAGAGNLIVRARLSRPVRKVRSLPKKTLPETGQIIAIVGADGSGKSTLARELARWLGWKFAVRRVYFGIPKDSLVVSFLRKARNGVARLTGRRRGSLWRLLDRMLWLRVARARRRTYREALRARASGAFVLAERYPLPALWDMSEPMDGPRIPQSAGRAFARERAAYASIGEPDLILVLDADLDTLRSRDAGVREEVHQDKARVVHSLGGHPKAHVIDAGSGKDEVLLEAKRAIWRHL